MRQCQRTRFSRLHWEHCCSLGRPGLPLRTAAKLLEALRSCRQAMASGCQPSLPRWAQTSDWLLPTYRSGAPWQLEGRATWCGGTLLLHNLDDPDSLDLLIADSLQQHLPAICFPAATCEK